jgi:hypothetical protein
MATMPVHVDDLIVSIRLVYSRRFFDLFESQITSQTKLIRASTASAFEKRMWSKEARQSLRYALFLRYYATFESRLKHICERFAKLQSLPLRLSDMAGENFLNKANKYLSRVADCAPLDKHPLWNDALSYSWIRNAIVHNDGWVSDVRNIPQYVARQAKHPSVGLRLSPKGEIVLNRQFCYRSVRNMAQLLLDIYGTSKSQDSAFWSRFDEVRKSSGLR